MIIKTDKGERIKTTESPRYREYSSLYYAAGYRWIKTRQAWSGSHLIHSFAAFEEEPGSK